MIVTLLLFLLVEFNDKTDNIEQCWRSLYDGYTLQYVIYTIAYIVPSVLSIGIITVFVILYYKIKPKDSKFNWFLLFPFGEVVFSTYFLILKIYLLVDAKGVPNGEIIYLIEPFL